MSKILVYSTEENIRETIKSILSDYNDLILTDSIDQCQECIKDTEISIILFDIGKAASPLEDIKSIHSDNTHLNIVVLINRSNEQTSREAIKAGAAGYITKPIKADELLKICK